MTMRKLQVSALALAASLLLGAAPAIAGAQFIIVNTDGPGEGFNDPTPAAPVGGNPGVTVGEQRLKAFEEAARIWGEALDSAVPIRIQAAFNPLFCSPTSATLGSARALAIFGNFANVPVSDTWYHVALGNRIAFSDLSPEPSPIPGFPTDDLAATFNSDLGAPGCLPGRGWYYGFDTGHGIQFNLVTVLLHEFAHGLGFSTFVNKSTGALAGPPFFHDVYERFLFDNRLGLHWDDMTNAQRASSILDYQRVAWDGAQTTAAVPGKLVAPVPDLKINNPVPGVPAYTPVGTASFGAPLNTTGVTGDLVIGLDAANPAGPTTTDACTPLTNGAAVAGKIAVVDRGTCGFTIKVKNAQDAGAIAVVVADHLAGSPPLGLGGVDPTITIPSVRVTLPDGFFIKSVLGSTVLNATLGLNSGRLQGADDQGRALMYTPVPLSGGSSISHWDTSAAPNLLMEPFINTDLQLAVDLTLPLFRDIGWAPDEDLDGVPDDQDECAGSDLAATVVIDGCDSGVANALFTNGCTISDLIGNVADGAGNHGGFVSGVAHLLNELKKDGVITGAQKGDIQSCAAGADIP